MILAIVGLVVKILLLVALLPGGFAYTMLPKRRLLGLFQLRLGPNRVGPGGLLQSMADALKMTLKEDLMPAGADSFVYRLAPVIAGFAALSVDAVIPFGAPIHLFGLSISWDLVNPSFGLLLVFAMSSLGVYGMVLGGGASQNKSSLLGGIRATARTISYELAMGLSLMAVLLMSHTAGLEGIVLAQKAPIWFWLPQIVPFLIFMVTAIVEAHRTPFDLPEAESELVTGYHTESSGMRFALYYGAEYIHRITQSGMTATLFFGAGWDPGSRRRVFGPSLKSLSRSSSGFVPSCPGFVMPSLCHLGGKFYCPWPFSISWAPPPLSVEVL